LIEKTDEYITEENDKTDEFNKIVKNNKTFRIHHRYPLFGI